MASLRPAIRNSRTHSDAQVAQIAASIRAFGWTNPILIDGAHGIIAGHGRWLAARTLELTEAPCIELAHLTPALKRAYVIADNKLAEQAGWDKELLALELGELKTAGFDLDVLGFEAVDLDALIHEGSGRDDARTKARATLAEQFLVPPFSVLNARESGWQERKQAWIEFGLRSEEGRDAQLNFSMSAQPPHVYTAKNAYEARVGHRVSWEDFLAAHPEVRAQTGTSVFDPVLCEVMYRWFSPPSGVVLDPFAGGSVRGVVAAKLGRRYVGCDLRAEQIEANRTQWADIGHPDDPAPVWHCGDSRNIDQYAQGIQADLVFSCPPYADLERYSDDPADLSNMGYPQFREAYRDIIQKSGGRLKNDRFACFVVGEVRSREGAYRHFVSDTIAAFTEAGLRYYNELILVTAPASLAIRAGYAFKTSRKIGKTHQNVLAFVKGDARRATQDCGEVVVETDLFPETRA